MNRVFLIIIDGLGVGAQEDAGEYGDTGADTLGKVSAITGVKLPNLEMLGLGNIRPFESIHPVSTPIGSYGKMRQKSAGKDSTTGHWEMAGIYLEKPFPTYPMGFPERIVRKFCSGIGMESMLCNKPYSGTKVIDDFGEVHMNTGFPIVYTSADSVFQVACHVDVVPVPKLYEWCEYARNEVMIGEDAVGRVIARPFKGMPGAFERVTDERHDFSLIPPQPNLMSCLQGEGVKTYSIGKIIDLFADQGFDQYRRTKGNAEGLSQLLSLMSADIENSFTFTNLIDTDQIYGHRQDPAGFASCLEEIDRAIPAIVGKLTKGDLLLITGDHGNDPADDSTDHTREFVPILALMKEGGKKGGLGIRNSFADVAETILDYFNINAKLQGKSFLDSV